MKVIYILLAFLALTLPYHAHTQDSLDFDLGYNISRVYPPVSITKAELSEAQTLSDINQYYKPNWVKEYITVEIVAIQEGKKRSIASKNDSLTQAQIDLINHADTATDIFVRVKYIPQNTLKQNTPKETDFTFSIEPENDASYSGGNEKLHLYLGENVGQKITRNDFELYQMITLTFSIDTNGQVVDYQILESPYQTFRNEAVEAILLEAICNMPLWIPARYADGSTVKQDFALTVGDHRSCLRSLVNTRDFPD